MGTRNDMDISRLSPQGFPYCPKCGGMLIWQNDWMPHELGYGEEGESDAVVHNLLCPECDTYYDVEDSGEEMHFLSTYTASDDEDDWVEPEVTEYALDKYFKDDE